MTAEFSDFLAAHAGRVAEQCSRRLVDAVLLALSADDLQPLATMYELARPDQLASRLETALRDVETVRRTALALAAEERLDPGSVASMAVAAGEEVGSLQRRLAVDAAATLERATRSAPDRAGSLSVTMHELRRPLTILNSYGQLLSTGVLGPLPEAAQVALEGITASTEMMVRMVGSLAELSRLEDPDDRMTMERLSAGEVVAAGVEPVILEARLRGTAIQTDAEPRVFLRGDRRRLALALTNLVGNALKHGPADSVVEVQAGRGPDGVRFSVRDHGRGFPEEDAPHLFDKYFRSVAERHRKVPGSGLGLYIVRTVAERHGGRVAARTVPGNGAEFEMIIPLELED